MNSETLITVVRVCITLTFLILAVGGPYALYRLNKFIKLYTISHTALLNRVADLERKMHGLEKRDDS